MSTVTLRKSTPQDVRTILALIQHLADFEKEPDAVLITEEELLRDGFGSDPAYECWLAEIGGEVIGMALFYIRYSTWKGKSLFLEDLIVFEQHRGKGAGRALFEKMLAICDERGYRRMDWQVLDWNTPAIDFYKSYGAEIERQWLSASLYFDR